MARNETQKPAPKTPESSSTTPRIKPTQREALRPSLSPGGSGIGPQRALEAIKPPPSAPARKPLLPRAYLRAQARSRGAQPNPEKSPPHPSVLRILKTQDKPPKQKPTQREAPRLSLSPGGSGIGPQRALEAIKPSPSAPARKPLLPPSLPASAGPVPRSLRQSNPYEP